MATIKGSDLMLFVQGKSIGYATNHTLSINTDTKETSTKDNGGKWQANEAGILSWSTSSENLMSNDQEGIGYADLVEYMCNRTPIEAVFSLEGDSDLPDNKLDKVPENGWNPLESDGYVGTVIITSIELNAPNGENATFTVQFTGVGALYENGWYLLKQDGTKTLIDNTTITVNSTDKYCVTRNGIYYSNSAASSSWSIPSTPPLQTYSTPSYKKFSKAATIKISIEYVGSSTVNYQMKITEQ